MLSVVIPALNASSTLPAVLDALKEGKSNGLVREIIVVDGGSRDDTIARAKKLGARVVPGKRGRGSQLRLGADCAAAPWLLFLHADTVLDDGWAGPVAQFIGRTGGDKAGVFEFALDDSAFGARVIECGVSFRTRRFGLAYGDQGLLMPASFYREIGGFRPLPLMEDVDLIRRIGRARLEVVRVRAVTSARRFKRGGYIMRPLRNMFLVLCFFAGVPPRLLARLY